MCSSACVVHVTRPTSDRRSSSNYTWLIYADEALTCWPAAETADYPSSITITLQCCLVGRLLTSDACYVVSLSRGALHVFSRGVILSNFCDIVWSVRYESFLYLRYARLGFMSELDVGPIFLTRPNPTRPRINMKLWTRPSPTHRCTTFSFVISCRIFQLVHQTTFQLRCQTSSFH